MKFISGLTLLIILGFRFPIPAQPDGFVDNEYMDGWNQAVGLTFDDNGRMYVWEKAGKIYTVEDGIKSATPLIDISEEVGNWRDFGLLGVALDPNFLNNGYIYLLYVVDRHHLLYYGTSGYDPKANLDFDATIGRITRYTVDINSNFSTVDYSSRKVLLGESINTGIAILHQSHGTGSLVFGEDGTLLVSTGDGASYSGEDVGGSDFGSYAAQGLADGIITAKENVGAFRSQLVDCLNGKILRIDPATGDGLPSNPFYDASKPRSAQSRVWALGLRNPFRMSIKPKSGSNIPGVGNPGVIYVGDVGWFRWEELNVIKEPGMNFGWPIYEGMEFNGKDRTPKYQFYVANFDAPNPLYDTAPGSICTNQYLSFHDLLQPATLDPDPSFPNSCNPAIDIPDQVNGNPIHKFVHNRPAMDWYHDRMGPARTGTFAGNEPAVINIGAPGSPVAGTQFGGNSATGGVWYTGNDFPTRYQNTYFCADYDAEWIQAMGFDKDHNPFEVKKFASGKGGVVALAAHPTEGLYYIRYASAIHKISYTRDQNQAPTAKAMANVNGGFSPLAIQFGGDQSTDPENGILTYQWDFGDGSPISNQANPTHTFYASSGQVSEYTVTLTVKDEGGLMDQMTLTISSNNTAPKIVSTSIDSIDVYSLSEETTLDLSAMVIDDEHPLEELSFAWQTIFHHNDHTHPEAADHNQVTTTLLSPLGCDEGEIYYYQVILTVTDPAGLSTIYERQLWPDCQAPELLAIPNQILNEGETHVLNVTATDTNGDPIALTATGLPAFASFADQGGGNGTLSINATAGDAGDYSITVKATDPGGLFDEETFILTVGAVNLPPVLAAIVDQTAAEGNPIQLPITATDTNGDPITLTATGLPAFASFADQGGGNGTLSINATAGDAGDYSITVKATDPGGLFDQETFTLAISAVNLPPQLTAISAQYVEEGNAMSLEIRANDLNGDILSLSIEDQPSFCVLIQKDNGAGILTISPQFGEFGEYTITVKAIDPAGLYDIEHIAISVLETKQQPHWQISSEITNVSCSGNKGSISLDATGGLGRISYLWSTGATTDKLTGATAGNYDVIITDQKGNSIDRSFIVEAEKGPQSIEIKQEGDYLYADAGDYQYQWNLNGDPIEGTIAKSIEAVKPGRYTVTITDQKGCSNTSEEFVVRLAFNRIKAYPNPVNDQFTLSFTSPFEDLVHILLLDNQGKQYELGTYQVEEGLAKLTFNLRGLNLAPGTYHAIVKSEQIQTKRIKLTMLP